MVELMVSLALSLFLILVAAQFFVANKMSYRTQQAQADVQERGRFASSWLAQQLRQAGYVANSEITTASATLFPASGSMAVGQVLAGSSSVLQLRYRGADDGNVVNCFGSAASAGAAGLYVIQTSGGAVVCNGSSVVPGVSQLRFEYGQDTGTDGVPDAYNATALASGVYAVRACMVVQSLDNNVSPAAVGFTDCYGAASSTTGNAIAKVFRTSVYLRNMQ